MHYICFTCGRSFTRADNLNRHMEGHSVEKKFKCSNCPKAFKRKADLARHERICIGEPQHPKPIGSGAKKTNSIITSPF